MQNQTALMCCFLRAYHERNHSVRVFRDPAAADLLTQEEYRRMADSLAEGIAFFAPDFSGTPEEALRLIVDTQLAPAVLARSAFCEKTLDNTVLLGGEQYLLLGAGYDTCCMRNRRKKLTVYELDRPELSADKQRRLAAAGWRNASTVFVPCDLSEPGWSERLKSSGFEPQKRTHVGLLGLTYYLMEREFRGLLRELSTILCEGSAICFDYPTRNPNAERIRQEALAREAGERMRAGYSEGAMERLLADYGFLVYEHLDAESMTEQYFQDCHRGEAAWAMRAPEGVCYCLAVKKDGLRNAPGQA